MIKQYLTFPLASLFILFCSNTYALQAPEGVRPCCAFGVDLKAEVAGIPIPFFSMENFLSTKELGSHIYNDDSQGVITSLFGGGKEKNGLIYTKQGGVIDIAHVRDTADYTYYLYQKLLPHIGQKFTLTLSDELRTRQINLYKNDQVLSDKEKQTITLKLAALLSFQLAQWHEIAQWYGLTSVGGWSEAASAFSPEDLYSNMLGATIAKSVLENDPNANLKQFSKSFEQSLVSKLKQLEAQSPERTKEIINEFDGKWWNSNERLPEKWIVLQRDYCLANNLSPNGVENGTPLSLKTNLQENNLSKWGELVLLPSEQESNFKKLPQNLLSKNHWAHNDFQKLANFAFEQDKLSKPEQKISVHQSMNSACD